MLSMEERRAKFMKISELAGDNDEIMTELKSLQDDDSEREGAGSKYSESDVIAEDGKRWSEKYEEMRTKYREAFFAGAEPKEEEITDPPEKNPAEEITFDDLFE